MSKSNQDSSRPFFERFALPILVVAMFLLPLVARGARQALLSNRNDVAQWLPANFPETTAFREFRKHFADEQFVLVSWDGCTMDDPRLEMFTKKIERGIREGFDTPKGRKMLFHEINTGPKLVKRLSTGEYPIDEKEVIERFSSSLIGRDGKLTSAVITFTPEGGEQGNLRLAVNVVRDIVSQCGVKPEELHMGGPPVDNVALDESGESSLFRLAGLAAAVGLFIAWWCLRIPKLIFLVFSAGIYSAMLSLAIVYYTGTGMNAILLTMPTLVYVAAISGAIHLTNYYREAVEHEGIRTAPGSAIRHAALPLGLATGTTAAGLASLCITPLMPIFQFGLYCALGVVASMIILVLVLPAALQLFPLPSHAAHAAAAEENKRWGDPLRTRRWRLVARGIIRHNRLVTVGCLLLMFGAGYGLRYAKTSVNLMRFFAPSSKIRQDYAWLETNLGELVPMEVVISFDKNAPLNMIDKMRVVGYVQEQVSEMPEVGEAMSALTFAPAPDDLEAQINEQYPGPDFIRIPETNRQTEEQLKETGYVKRDENGNQLWRVTARLGALEEIDYGLFVANIQRTVEKAIDDMKNVEGADPELLGKKSIAEIKYTGLVPLIYTAQHRLLEDLIWGFVGDWFLVTVVMVIVIRNLSSGVLLMLPAVFPAAIVFGMMGWTGLLIDTGTVMTPAVALGVTVDDVVHFMLKFRDAMRLGKRRRHAIMYAYEHCAQAMYQSWGVIALGLSVFAFSPFMPTKSFGWMMLTLLSASLVGNLVMLPALLASPLGGLFAWGIRRRDEKTAKKKNAREVATPHGVEQPAYTHAAVTRHSRITDSVPR